MQEHELILKALKQTLRNQHFIMYEVRRIRETLRNITISGKHLNSETFDRLRKETGKLYEVLDKKC